jgi:hypothetical protein
MTADTDVSNRTSNPTGDPMDKPSPKDLLLASYGVTLMAAGLSSIADVCLDRPSPIRDLSANVGCGAITWALLALKAARRARKNKDAAASAGLA